MSVNLQSFTETKFDDVAHRVSVASEAVKTFLDQKLEDIIQHRGVNHPFLNRYAREGLKGDDEKVLYLETYYYFRDVPFYICEICTLTRDERILREVVANVADEMGSKKSHSQIYLEFMHAIGLTREDIDAHTPLSTTVRLNEGIRNLYRNPTPLVKALGALYAEECQSASMVYKYNEGLKVTGRIRQERAFWELHVKAEVGHSNAVFNCAHPYLGTEENLALFSQGIQEYMAHLERYWDGIERLLDKERS